MRRDSPQRDRSWPLAVMSECWFSHSQKVRFPTHSGHRAGIEKLTSFNGEFGGQSGHSGDIFPESSGRLKLADS